MRKGEKNNGEFSKIQVFARCRPLNGIERKSESPSVVEVFPKDRKVTVRERNKEFTFDKVFQPDVKQIDVYKSVAEPLVQEVLKGFNCTILAYGLTGTGKTYTMEGERNNSQCSWEDDPGAGIIPRSLHQLFEELNKGENVEFSVKVSFLELYNEELLDLLSSKEELTRLRIFENTVKKGSVYIDGLEEIVVHSKDEVYTILEKGTARRQTAATLLNASSSRSHTVFSVTVHIKENTSDGEELVKTGKLNLVDLAGSECVGRSGCVNQRLREASNINMSLLTLGRVISALIENHSHIPYRESKLTRLLQDSLGGHTKTSFIATISPAQSTLEETLSTLDYATKAKNITNKPIINEKMTKRALIRELTEEIERLRKDLSALRNGQGFYVDSQNYAQMEKQITETTDKIKLLEEEIEDLKLQNKEIEQSHALIIDKLHLKTRQHEETVSKLTEVSENLCSTEKVLSKTALDRDEKAYLLNIHHNKEKQLFKQNRELHHVVDESIADVDKLHLKVERKKKVDTTNEKSFKQFQQKYHMEFAQLHDMVNSLKQEHVAHLNNLANSLKNEQEKILEEGLDIYSGILNYHQQSSDVLHKIETNQSSFLKDLSSTLSNDATEQGKTSKMLLKSLNSKKNALLADQEMFCNENIPLLSDMFSSMMTEMKSWFFDNHSRMIQKIESFRNQMKTQLEEKCKEIKDVSSNLETFIQHHSIMLTKSNEVQIKNSLIDKEIDADISQVSDLLNKISKNHSLKKENASLIEVVTQNMEKNVADLISIKNTFHKHLDTSNEETAASSIVLDDISSSFKPVEFTSQLDAVNSFKNSEKSEITTFIKNNQQKQVSSIDMIKDEIVANEIVTLSNYDSTISKLKEIQISLCDGIRDDVSNLNGCKNNVLDMISSTETIIKDSKQDLQESCQQLSKEILQKDLEIEKFISEDLKKDIPTGTTPQRKTYYYSKELITLSPDEDKLRLLRKIRGEHTEKAVNLQLDCSFDESDEFKSPLSQEFCEVTTNIGESIHNVAFTNGEDYLTDCETLSNASSTSDLSVTGLKNKENFSAFLKPSKNKPNVKRHKKKLVESSIPTLTQRKPLSSKNPSLLG